ncbi:hypothetical protein BU26DRAFT_106788 [Trematosphaeria pertusa]|uniref:Uncharacterized protein n=1 Tax=Trematosphaeria pertusa TaxID=390896 RepID=A0A6A6I064_9PLEO|nr:uncharacterized protein BU26DRAFT_106788 [Trematosphaeria pertusa]KAF2243677.1 hypothetical protein BU26DRAFT_106788 [Trematosphaeria pertusa]
MGRSRGPKFSFPLPGRNKNPKVDKNKADASPIPSITSTPAVPEWAPRYDEPSSYSKAQRVLGTAGPPFRPSSRQASVPPSPGYMTITVSEPGSEFGDKPSPTATEESGMIPPRRPNMSNRASSNVLPTSFTYNGEERRGSNCSSVSRHLHPSTSNSTMRSHYDPQTSPLYISQQTSDSAVRDRALRRGMPPIGTYDHDHVPSPLAQEISDEAKRQHRKSKPPRLDLSKLFPKPKSHGGQGSAGPLLSPNKLVNSPTALSTVSDYFPRPMTREPTPTPRGHAKLTKPATRQHPSAQPPRSTSPVRLHKRDTYDNAKINVRRPPRGIQHWFEGLDEDSDELLDDQKTPVPAPIPVNPNGQPLAPMRKSSLGRLIPDNRMAKQQGSRAPQYIPDPRKEQFIHANSSMAHRLNSPSQFSVQSQSSVATTRTKESAFSKSNLQDSSVLSFSSSEDEDEHVKRPKGRVPVRDSIDMTEDHGDIVIGQAQAYEVRPRNSRRPSAGKLSLLSTSTNAATIEVMYTPEPYTPQHFPRNHSSSRRSSHLRQPSVIPEDEDVRPKTAAHRPLSPSSHSIRTSVSEPRPRGEMTHKMMAVTAEEEALLEMMRKKRAAMVKQSWTEGYHTAIGQEDVRQKTPPEMTSKIHRTSAFLSVESPSASPVRVVETKKSARKSFAPSPSPLLLAPSRGRPIKAAYESAVGSSMLRDSSSCDPGSERQVSPSPSSQATLAHHLSPPPESSPLDPFPTSTPTASIASPTTTDHPPSPVTPGLRHGENDVDVKVAGSEPSCNGDNDEVTVLETGVIDMPSGSIKQHPPNSAHHQRRRTASSGADVPTPLGSKLTTRESCDPPPFSEASSRPSSRTPSIFEHAMPQPKLPKKSPQRQSSLSASTTVLPKSRHNSIVSSRTSSPVASTRERRSSRAASRVSSMASMKKETVAVGTASTRCSVSEDVLAAWGSLGGMRDYDTLRY